MEHSSTINEFNLCAVDGPFLSIIIMICVRESVGVRDHFIQLLE